MKKQIRSIIDTLESEHVWYDPYLDLLAVAKGIESFIMAGIGCVYIGKL